MVNIPLTSMFLEISTGLDKNLNLTLPIGQPAFNSASLAWRYIAQSPVNGSTSHENVRPCLPVRLVTNEIYYWAWALDDLSGLFPRCWPVHTSPEYRHPDPLWRPDAQVSNPGGSGLNDQHHAIATSADTETSHVQTLKLTHYYPSYCMYAALHMVVQWSALHPSNPHRDDKFKHPNWYHYHAYFLRGLISLFWDEHKTPKCCLYSLKRVNKRNYQSNLHYNESNGHDSRTFRTCMHKTYSNSAGFHKRNIIIALSKF